MNVRYRLLSSHAMNGRTSMKKWPRNSRKRTRHWRISDVKSRGCEGLISHPVQLCLACLSILRAGLRTVAGYSDKSMLRVLGVATVEGC